LLWWVWQVSYSVFLSPLRNMPSPWVFQLFPIYFYVHVALGDSHLFLHHYFLKYGPVFRAGWKLVLFVDGDAAIELYSTYKLQKSTDYDIFSAFGPNLLTIKHRAIHSTRRRKVGPVLTKQSIAKMEPAIIESSLKPLLNNFDRAATSGETINLYLQFHYFSWDMIGRLAFGESFNMLKNGSHPAVKWLKGVLEHAMISLAVPFYNFRSKDAEKLTQFANGVLNRYLKRTSSDCDIIGHFLNNKGSPALTRDEIFAESFLQLFAGTDTSSNTLNWFFYLILTHPEVEAKIVKEIQDAGLLKPGRILTLEEVSDRFPYFEMALKESMRFLPAIPGTPFRMVPKGARRCWVITFLREPRSPSQFIPSTAHRKFGKVPTNLSQSGGAPQRTDRATTFPFSWARAHALANSK
ncbi:hypothetical protein L0F63_005025, partial [Massospora cicadina]